MPLTEKGEEIKSNMEKEYGPDKGESVFYASRNKGTISGVDAADTGAAELEKLEAKADALSYRSSGYELSKAGEDAFAAKQTLASVKDQARSAGLDSQQTKIMVSGWKNARDEAKGRGDADGEDASKKKDEGDGEAEAGDLPTQLKSAEAELAALEREQDQSEESLERQNMIDDTKGIIRGLRTEIKDQAKKALSGGVADALGEMERREDEAALAAKIADACSVIEKRMDAYAAKHCADGEGEKPKPKEPQTEGRHGYNPEAVNKAIGSSRQKIGGKEARAIHALMRGR
jgi:hypothetical protein